MHDKIQDNLEQLYIIITNMSVTYVDVLFRCFFDRQQPHYRKETDRQKCCYSYRERLGDPVNSHDDNSVSTFCLLKKKNDFISRINIYFYNEVMNI